MTKAQLIDKYEAEICELKREARSVYVGETFSLHQSDGELYVEHPNGTLVFDIINLHRNAQNVELQWTPIRMSVLELALRQV